MRLDRDISFKDNLFIYKLFDKIDKFPFHDESLLGLVDELRWNGWCGIKMCSQLSLAFTL